MCGICGYVGWQEPEWLRRMRDTLTHRGPDDAGLFHDERVGLGHRRQGNPLSARAPLAGE